MSRGGGGAFERPDRGNGCSLLVRNLSKYARPEDLRYSAEKYGPVRDVYIPRDFHTKETRGIGFIEFQNARDAEEAVYGLDRKVIEGKEISVVVALQGRKRPDNYRGYDRDYESGYRQDRDRDRDNDRDRDRDYDRPRGRDRSRSRGPSYGRHSPRRPAHSPSPSRSPSRSATRSPDQRRDGDKAQDDAHNGRGDQANGRGDGAKEEH